MSQPALQAHTDLTFDNIPEGMGCFAQMGPEGDIKYTWDPKKPEDVEAARAHFNDLKSKGFIIFKMRRWCKTEEMETFDPQAGRLFATSPEEASEPSEPDGEIAQEFDPDAKRYVAAPQMRGG